MFLSQDRARLDQFRRGERAALEAVFHHYGGQVAKWVAGGFTFTVQDGRRRFDGFRSAVDQHDVIHEVFRTAFQTRTRESYSGLVPFEGYLFTITKNTVLKKLRLKERDRPLDDEMASQIPSGTETPEDQYARHEQAAVVREFLSALPAEDRTFVDLRFVEQLGQVEVAERLGWGRKKVRLKEAAIREQLIRFMKRRRGSHELREEVLCSATPTS